MSGLTAGIGLSCGFAVLLVVMLFWHVRSIILNRRRIDALLRRSFDYADGQPSASAKMVSSGHQPDVEMAQGDVNGNSEGKKDVQLPLLKIVETGARDTS